MFLTIKKPFKNITATVALILAVAYFTGSSHAATLKFVENNPSYQAQLYLTKQIKGIGLVDSYIEDNQNLSYVYDNALTAMAFIATRDYGRAEQILNTLSLIRRNAQGAYYESYNFLDINGSGQGNAFAGNTAWVLEALNLYQRYTGSFKYFALQRKLADYLISQQDIDGGIRVLPGNPVKSTEQNIAAYVALRNFGTLYLMRYYTNKALKIRNFLANNIWIPSENRFRTSLPDPQPSELLTWVTDVQALGVLALGKKYAAALTWADDPTHLRTSKTTPSNIPITGFDFNSDLDTVWLEGTFHMGLAYKKTGNASKAQYYVNEGLKAQNADGSILLATNTGTASIYWMLTPWHAAAPTAWLIFNMYNFNPLDLF